MKDPLPPAVVKVAKEVFDKLGCERCLSQNRNESLHHVTWGMVPKEQYVSPKETYFAVCLSILLFNEKVKLHMVSYVQMLEGWKRIDNEHMRGSDYKEKARWFCPSRRCNVKLRGFSFKMKP